MKNNDPIFIVGSPRSGTTLLQRIIRSHSNISSPTGESQFIVPLYRNVDIFGDLSRLENIRRVLKEMYRINPNYLETDFHGIRFDIPTLSQQFYDEKRNTLPKIISGLLEKNANGEGKGRWLDKTPYYTLHMKTLKELFPNARFVHIIRDGRDCALSMLKRRKDLNIHNIFFAGQIWKQYVETGQEIGSKLGSKRYFELRYEDLIKDQDYNIKGICKFLGEDFENSMIDFQKSTDKYNKTPLLAKPIQTDNHSKWLEKMPARQVRVFESVAGDTLKRNNYNLRTDAKPLLFPFKAFYIIQQRIRSKHF